MPSRSPRYYIPQHPSLAGPHTKDELFVLVERGSIGRGEIILDRVTGNSHKVGELISGMKVPVLMAEGNPTDRPAYQELSGDTPWELPGTVQIEPEEGPAPEETSRLEEGEDPEGAEYEIEMEDGDEAFHGHPSWLSFTKWILLALLMVGLGVLAYPLDWRFLAAGCVAGSITLCGVILSRQHRDYIITTERIEQEWGIIGRSSREVRIRDIRSIDVEAKGLMGLLGIGTVNISSAGSEDVEVQFKDIRRAHQVKKLVRQLQERIGA